MIHREKPPIEIERIAEDCTEAHLELWRVLLPVLRQGLPPAPFSLEPQGRYLIYCEPNVQISHCA